MSETTPTATATTRPLTVEDVTALMRYHAEAIEGEAQRAINSVPERSKVQIRVSTLRDLGDQLMKLLNT